MCKDKIRLFLKFRVALTLHGKWDFKKWLTYCELKDAIKWHEQGYSYQYILSGEHLVMQLRDPLAYKYAEKYLKD